LRQDHFMTSDNEHWQIYCNARTPKGAVNWPAMGQAKKRFARFKEQHPWCCFCDGKLRPSSLTLVANGEVRVS
jgi:hypothetical protein